MLEQDNNSNAAFGWDSPNENVFFGQDITTGEPATKDVEDPKKKAEEVVANDPKKVKKETTNETNEDEDDEPLPGDIAFKFDNKGETNPLSKKKGKKEEVEDEEEENSSEESTEKGKKKDENTTTGAEARDNVYITFANELKEKGTLSEGIEIPKDLNDEGLPELVEKEFEVRIESAINDFAEELKNDAEAIAYLNFRRKGGKTSDFLRVYGQSELPNESELTKEDVQDKVLRKFYSEVEQLDAEDIEDKLEWLKEGGKKEKYAKKYFSEMKEAEEEAKAELIKSVEDQKRNRETNDKKLKEVVSKTITESTIIGEIKLTPKDKKDLPDYISKRTVKISPNQTITQVQADINEMFKSPAQLILLAKFVKAKGSIKEFEAAKASIEVKKAKATIKASLEGRTIIGSAQKTGSLADLF